MKHVQTKDVYLTAKNGYKSLGLSVARQGALLVSINKLVKYLTQNEIFQYSKQSGDDFIAYSVSNGNDSTQNHRRALDLFNNIIEGKGYEGRKKKCYHFLGDVGREAQDYIALIEEGNRLSQGSIWQYKRVLSDFPSLMSINNVTATDINEGHLLEFISSVRNRDPHNFSIIRKFMAYLVQKGLIISDFSECLSGFATPAVKLPSVYDAEEIAVVEKAIDRTSPIGKRDYAMLLLASRLGLRASDIADLEFSSLDWRKNRIVLTQTKTKIPIELPLTNDVGIALIDYLQNARPEVDSSKVFLTMTSPLRPVSKNCVSRGVSLAFSASGIDTKERHHSSHSLRHSLATRFLRNNVGLPVISEVLGHRSSESTKVYLEVDVDLLLQCSLDVPKVDENFYKQEGGWFYE